MQASPSFPDRDTVSAKLTALSGEDQAWLMLLMENAQQDESFLGGLQLYLEQQAAARFLNEIVHALPWQREVQRGAPGDAVEALVLVDSPHTLVHCSH